MDVKAVMAMKANANKRQAYRTGFIRCVTTGGEFHPGASKKTESSGKRRRRKMGDRLDA